MNFHIEYIGIIFMLGSVPLFGQYPWPVPNMYEQHPIIGTLGEFRGFGRVLHEGVDVGEPTNIEVVANISGTVDAINTGYGIVAVKDEMFTYRYIHIWPDPALEPDSPVVFGQLLGKINEENHLHFEYEYGLYNPLHFLTPFWDYCSPEIEKIEVVKDGTPGAGEPFPIEPETGLPLASGHVDIKAWAWDHRVEPDGGSGDKGCAPYKIGYAIYDEQGNLIEGAIYRIQFYQTLGYNVGWIYVPGSSYEPPPPVFIYWVTNYVDKNGNWDTYPLKDGKYRIDVVAYDIQGMYEIKHIWVKVKNELPVVISTDPADGASDVDVYKKITIVFNKTMDTGQGIRIPEYQVIRGV